MPISLVLADDHPIVLQGLQQLFERQEDFTVVARCASGEEAVAAVRAERPDVLVLDLKMPGRNGLDVLRTISTEQLACRTVLLTAAVRDDEVAEAVKLGVMGVVLKESAPETLVECVRRVYHGERCIERDPGQLRAGAANLTPREIEIVRMVASGLRNRVIGDRLSITEGTVKVHLHNIYEKLGVEGRLELVLRAQAQGLI